MYVDRNPAELEFRCGPQGKPSLSGEDGVSFNISQSGSLALYAIVRNREVGVDLESVRPELADDGVAKLVFSSTELSQLGTLPAQDRCAAFFTCWTKKEAYVKATGEGFAAELASLTVHAHDGPVVLKEAGGPWFVRSIPAALGYAAAVAADGTEWTLRRFDWPPLYSPLSAEPSAHRR
jgi:4'-phosphopantetheinyl transferase